LTGNNLVLRPHNQTFPVQVISLAADKTAADYILGRICYVGIEI
jgi:hypothetical protein